MAAAISEAFSKVILASDATRIAVYFAISALAVAVTAVARSDAA